MSFEPSDLEPNSIHPDNHEFRHLDSFSATVPWRLTDKHVDALDRDVQDLEPLQFHPDKHKFVALVPFSTPRP